MSTNAGHYLSTVKVGDIWFECDDVKITKIEFNHFYNSNTVCMLFYKRSTRWKHLRGNGLVPMDRCCLIDTILNRFILENSCHALLTFIYFCYFLILWPLSHAASNVSRYCYCFVCSGLHIEYTGEVVPLCTYIVRVVIV